MEIFRRLVAIFCSVTTQSPYITHINILIVVQEGGLGFRTAGRFLASYSLVLNILCHSLAAQIKITGCVSTLRTLRASVSPSPTSTPLKYSDYCQSINNHVFALGSAVFIGENPMANHNYWRISGIIGCQSQPPSLVDRS